MTFSIPPSHPPAHQPATRPGKLSLVKASLETLLAPLLLSSLLPAPLLAQSLQPDLTSPEAKGAQMYCFMRRSGNGHEVSWNAAYALIKRQSASLFKTSPQHASVMISEAVVRNPDAYPECGRYLGALFGGENPATAGGADGSSGTTPISSGPVPIQSRGTTRSDRYGY
jgi:hypothetical protein